MALLENIQIFVRTIELGSLSSAGRQLRLSPAVMSHRLQRAESVAADAGGTARGNIRLTAPLGLGRSLLGGLLTRFQDLYPQISVRLRLSDHVLDLLGEAVDLAVRLAILHDSSLIARKIADCPRILCASPAYISAHGPLEEPEDLLNHNCLLLRYPGSQQFRWTLRGKDGDVTLPVQGSLDADDGDLLTQWALAGRGIVLKPMFEITDALNTGALVPVLPKYRPHPATLAIIYPHRRLLSTRTKIMTDFLVQEITPQIVRLHEAIDPALLNPAG